MKLYDEDANIDILSEPLFLGKGKNIQRYDIMKHSTFYDIGEKMDENFWKPAEIPLDNDKKDFLSLLEQEHRIFTFNLKRQIVLDSIQGRSPLQTFGRVCTNPALESAMTKLQYQEVNHSDTYSYILRNLYDNPAQIFDTILDDEVITRHTKSITNAYNKLYDIIGKWEVNPDSVSEYELKESIWLALVAWYILEGIRFFVSFACTFAFAENKKMIGNAQELKLIARDELTHLNLTRKMINILKNNEDEGFFEVIKNTKDQVTELFKEAANNEIEWAGYLFKDGSMLGLNTEILSNYMKFITNQRLRAIKEPKMFKDISQSPLPWMDSWLGMSREEVLPQEVSITEYKIGVVTDMTDSDWTEI